MKKLISLLLALIMVLSLCACGEAASPDPAADSNEPEKEAVDTEKEAADAERPAAEEAEKLKNETIPTALQGVWLDTSTDGILTFYNFIDKTISIGVVNMGVGAADSFSGTFTVEDSEIRYQLTGATAKSQYTYENDTLNLSNANGMPLVKNTSADLAKLIDSEEASGNNAGVVYLANLIISAYPDSDEAATAADKKTAAEAAITAAGEAALATLRTAYDKVQQLTWYESNSQPIYVDIDCFIYPYIGRMDNGSTWLRVKLNYTDAKTDAGWIFFNKVVFSIDGENTTKAFSRSDIVRDNDTEVWETADYEATATDIALLREIANSTETIIRFQGDEYYVDHVVTAEEKTAIVNVLTAYNYLSSLPA